MAIPPKPRIKLSVHRPETFARWASYLGAKYPVPKSISEKPKAASAHYLGQRLFIDRMMGDLLGESVKESRISKNDAESLRKRFEVLHERTAFKDEEDQMHHVYTAGVNQIMPPFHLVSPKDWADSKFRFENPRSVKDLITHLDDKLGEISRAQEINHGPDVHHLVNAIVSVRNGLSDVVRDH